MKRREILDSVIAEAQAWLDQHATVPVGRIQPFAIEEAQISMMIPIYSVNEIILTGLKDIGEQHGLQLSRWRIRANENDSERTPASMLWFIVDLTP